MTLHNAGPVALGPDMVALDVGRDPAGTRNGALHALHAAVFDAIAPGVMTGCEFTAVEPARRGISRAPDAGDGRSAP